MGCQIVFTKPAVADLAALVSFIARDNPEVAERFGYEIVEKTQTLDQFPLLGRVAPEFKDEAIREIIHRPYRIVYRVRADHKRVEILRVWHAARGIPRLHE
jgi:toxin ParE1/3/4